MKTEDKMELIELRTEDVRGCNEMRASHKNLLSVQKSTVIEWWLLSIQDKADSMAAASSS